MIIKVTKRHIEDATNLRKLTGRVTTNSCPIALALQEKLYLNSWNIEVTNKWIRIAGENFNVPKKVAKFVNNYDDYIGKPMPFRFRIRKPKAYID